MHFIKKILDWFLKSNWVSLLNRSIQDLSNHGASKEPKKTEEPKVPLMHHDPRDLEILD